MADIGTWKGILKTGGALARGQPDAVKHFMLTDCGQSLAFAIPQRTLKFSLRSVRSGEPKFDFAPKAQLTSLAAERALLA